MTEQEKRQRRREMERRMRSREAARRTEVHSGTLAFRAYVSAVLVGGCLLLSLFDSASSQAVCQRIRQTIASQISVEQVRVWQEKAEALIKESGLSLPVFGAFGNEAEPQEQEKIYLPDTEDSP